MSVCLSWFLGFIKINPNSPCILRGVEPGSLLLGSTRARLKLLMNTLFKTLYTISKSVHYFYYMTEVLYEYYLVAGNTLVALRCLFADVKGKNTLIRK